MKKYMKPTTEVINIITEGTILLNTSGAGATLPGAHNEIGGKPQYSNKKSLWDNSNDILGR